MEMKRKLVIEYGWWNHEEEIPEHTEALEESAMERIKDLMSQGYTSGELHDNIRMLDSDGDDGIEYTGWWSISGSTS